MTEEVQEVPNYKCGLDDPKWKQCCCDCYHHVAVHYHCTTEPKPDKSLHSDSKCCCSVQKGWACILGAIYRGEEDHVRIYDNWPEHSVGCEMYSTKKKRINHEDKATS